MHVAPPAPRFATEVTADGLRVQIPSRRSWLAVVFLCMWLTGWAVGEVHVARQLLSPTPDTEVLFLCVWLIGWTMGGAYALGTVLWQLGGREVLTIDGRTLAYRIEAFGLGHSRHYGLGDVQNLRVTGYPASARMQQAAWTPPLFGSGIGPLAFDYGARTFCIGPALDEAEARLLLERLARYVPHTRR